MPPKYAKTTGARAATSTRTEAAPKQRAEVRQAQAPAALAQQPARPAPAAKTNVGNIEQKIAERAFLLFEKRGCAHGYHDQDWIEAESQIKRELKVS